MKYAKSEQTRRKLIETTAHHLRAKGAAATGLSEILQDSGVPRGSLYHHFPGGKEELVLYAIMASGESITQRLSALLKRTGGLIEAVSAFCDHYIAQLHESAYTKGCPIATVTLESAADVDSVHEATAKAFNAMLDFLCEALTREGLEAKVAYEQSVVIISTIEGALLLAKSLRSTRPLEIARDQLVHMLKAHLNPIQDKEER